MEYSSDLLLVVVVVVVVAVRMMGYLNFDRRAFYVALCCLEQRS